MYTNFISLSSQKRKKIIISKESKIREATKLAQGQKTNTQKHLITNQMPEDPNQGMGPVSQLVSMETASHLPVSSAPSRQQCRFPGTPRQMLRGMFPQCHA